MAALFPDPASRENHLRLKRWERARQGSAWRQRAAEDQCAPWSLPWRGWDGKGNPECRPALLLALFPQDLALVRYLQPEPGDHGLYLIRGGFPGPQGWSHLLLDYRAGRAVPAPFQPRRRLPPAWIEAALQGSASEQAEWIQRLRSAGLLPPLGKLDAEGVSPWLRWEEARSRLLDFRATDSPRFQS